MSNKIIKESKNWFIEAKAWFVRMGDDEISFAVIIVIAAILLISFISLGVVLIKVATEHQNNFLVFIGIIMTLFLIGILYYVVHFNNGKKIKDLNNNTNSTKSKVTKTVKKKKIQK